jgi:hypothetical protein
MSAKIKNVNFTYLFVLATVSFLWFLLKERTAYEWPAIDMMPFFERYYDNNFLINDFYTNSISNEPNPRWAFGYLIIALTKIFHTDWYSIFYSLKVFLVIFTPIFYYLSLYFIIGKYIDEEKLKNIQIVILLAILIIMYPRLSGLFSIAWWKPYYIQATAQNISLFLGLLALVIREVKCDSKFFRAISVILFGIATFIHPAIGLFVISFYLLSSYQLLKSIKNILSVFLIGYVLPVIAVIILFSPKTKLNPIDFVNIYAIENHSSHYHLEHFGTLTGISWIYSFILMLILLIIPALFAYIKKLKSLLILSSLFLASLLLSVACQYLFIDIFPSKVMASIGPVRFTQFAYWMIVISWAIMLSNLSFLTKINFDFHMKKTYLLFIFGYVVIGISVKDSPKENIYSKNKDFYEFMETTEKDSVFAVYFGNLKIDIPNIAQRAVLVGNGFPFNEAYFKEYQDRKKLLYGSREDLDKIEGSWEGEKIAKFFRTKKPKDFVEISKKYRLDYVVIEAEYSSNFQKYKPKFENQKVKIYKISDFKE